METIRNYLEAMFANLPNTPDVLRAKDELLQMMEDKYSELIEEGKSENEAVGTVIAEFGNLDELADSLGLKTALAVYEEEPKSEKSRRLVTLEEAKDFLNEKSVYAFCVALGVFGCIVSVIGPIIFGSILEHTIFEDFLSMVGVLVMFGLVTVSVLLFVYAGRRMKRWEFLEKEPCTLDYATTNYVIDEQKRFHTPGNTALTIGIILCATGWLPGVLIDSLLSIFVPFDLGFIIATLLFLFEGVGVFLIVYSSIMKGRFTDLLKLNDKNTVSGTYKNTAGRTDKDTAGGTYKNTSGGTCKNTSGGNYTRGKNRQEPDFENEKVSSLMSIYWPAVTCFYLIYSFLTFDWGRSWLIWPVAGVIRKVICANLGIREDSK